MWRKIVMLLIVLMGLWTCQPVFAGNITEEEINTVVGNQLEVIGLSELEAKADDILEGEMEYSFLDTVTAALTGQLSLSPMELVKSGAKTLFKELHAQLYLIQRILVVALLSAILKTINASFNGKAVGELSFYVCYIVLVFMILETFGTGTAMVREVCDRMVEAMKAMLPVFTTLMISTGSYTQLAIMGPVIIGAAGLICSAIAYFILPAITASTTLHMVNHLSEKSILSNMTALLKDVISWGLKGCAIAFMAIVSLQRLGAPLLNQMLGKTARVAVSSIPIVGDIMTGAVEMAATLGSAMKNGVAVAAVLFLVVICFIPIIKLVAMILVYKLTAAVLEPICEARLIKCISAAGDFSVLLLGTLFTVEVLFIFSVIVLLSTA